MTLLTTKCDAVRREALAHLAGDTSTLEKERFSTHLSVCPQCRDAVAELSSMMESSREHPFVPTAAAKDRMFDGVMHRIETAPAPARFETEERRWLDALAKWRFRWRFAAVAIVVAGGLAALTIVLTRGPVADEQAPMVQIAQSSPSPATSTDEILSTAHLAPHLSIGIGRDARWSLDRNEGTYRLLLENGELWIRYDKRLGNKPLEVSGNGVTATVVGTVLTVSAEPGRVMAVGVLEGKVAVASDMGRRLVLAEGDWLSREGERVEMAVARADQGRAWLASLPEEPPRFEDAGDEADPGAVEPPAIADGKAAERRPVSQSDTNDLYRQAESKMASGQLKEAAMILERLIRKSPGSGTADTARLDLAGLYTRRLSKPKRAAAHLSDYLARHPTGPQSSLVRARLCRIARTHAVDVTVTCD